MLSSTLFNIISPLLATLVITIRRLYPPVHTRLSALNSLLKVMAAEENVLELIKQEPLPDTFIYQLDDGTIFYHTYSYPERLYVKLDGNEIDAALPYGDIHNLGAHGNAIYFRTMVNGKIYKAQCFLDRVPMGDSDDPPTGTRCYRRMWNISVDHLRDQLETETVHGEALCTIDRGGKKYAYRLGDDPECDGILVDAPADKLTGLKLLGFHRGKVLYTKIEAGDLSVQKLGENVLLILLPIITYHSRIFARDESPLIYLTNGTTLVTLNTESMEFLQSLQFRGATSISSFAGIRNGVITVRGKVGDENYLMHVQLPAEYVI